MKTLWRWWSLSCQWSTVNDINAKFRRHVETTLLFLLSTTAYHLPTSPSTAPSPQVRRHFTPLRASPPPRPTLTWLCFSFYQVASFPCIASPISLSRLGSTKGIPRLGLLYPLKRFSPYFNEKSFLRGAVDYHYYYHYYYYSSATSSLLHPPPWPLHSSATPPCASFEFCLFSSLSIYKYHLDFVLPNPCSDKVERKFKGWCRFKGKKETQKLEMQKFFAFILQVANN